MGLLLGYSIFMTFIFLLPIPEARKVFKIFHPSFGVDLPERSYADDCRVFTPENPVSNYFNIYDAVFDVHFIAHLGGWWFKMMIIRDTKIAWIISISFELIEISFRHWLKNFWECWWDHVSQTIFHHLNFTLIYSYFLIFSDAICLESFWELGLSNTLEFLESTGCTKNLSLRISKPESVTSLTLTQSLELSQNSSQICFFSMIGLCSRT
jgi:hypothetical protein